jgi:hypothetical protein
MLSGVIQFDKSPSTASKRLLSFSEKRVSITFFPPQTGSAFLSNDPGLSANQGMTLVAGMVPIYLDRRLQGDCVMREWFVVYDSTGTGVSWIEAMH